MTKPYLHQVKYYECDRMGVTHHSNYIRFMEEARIDWMDQLGYGFERMEAEGIVSPVVAISCNYKRTTTFKDLIEIQVKVGEMSELKISFTYTASRSSTRRSRRTWNKGAQYQRNTKRPSEKCPKVVS